jgi:hypothetical protein
MTALGREATASRTLPPDRGRKLDVRLVALGMLLLQLAWVFAVPPFRGSDEFDHAYKAAAVARGQWVPSPSSATRGTGALLDVPSDIVAAARPECEDLPYTEPADCVGVRHGDTTRVASGAGRYAPLYYAVVGTVGLPFSGTGALYAMRLATVFLSWILFVGALLATRTWARTNLPLVAIAIGCVPVLVYSTSIVAPNGVEMMAGLMLWCALIGLTRDVGQAPYVRAQERRLWAAAAIAGGILVTTRSLGPLWCLMTVAVVLLSCTPSRARWASAVRTRAAWFTGAFVLACTITSVAWTTAMGSLKLDTMARPEDAFSLGHRVRLAAHDIPLTIFQSIAAFPFRNQATQPIVYVCFLVLILGLLGAALRSASGRVRLGLLVALGLAVVVPVAVQVGTYNSYGNAWQGRYALPFVVGIPLLAAVALEERERAMGPRVAIPGLLLFVVGQVVGPVDVLRQELATSPLADSSAWVHPSPVGLAVIASVAAGVLWLGVSTSAMGIPSRAGSASHR